MAETETRLETLEDEVKVLKGEVKRTLVDLRALLMREDSPLGEGAAAKRMAGQNAGPANAIPANEGGMPAAGTPPAPGLEAPALPPAPEAKPQAISDPGPGPPPDSASYSQAFAPPGALPADNSVEAAQEEPMMSEQEGPLTGENHKMAESGLDDEPSRAIKPRKPSTAEPDGQYEFPNGPENAFAETGREVESEEDGRSKDSSTPGRKGRSRAGLKSGLEEKLRLDQEAGEEEVRGEKKSDSRGKSERVTSIYDEYRELLEETRQTHTIEDQPVGPPLDVNLMANLVYWASLAKQRVGETQLKDILQLYIQSGHSRPELQDLMLQICKMVDVESAIIEENGSDWVDLLFHLHGILTGGFPVIKIPYIGLLAQEEA